MDRIGTLTVGPLATNCYLLGGDKADSIVIIDPGDEAELLLDEADEMAGTVAAILITHGHVDHIAAAAEVQRATGAKLYVHAADAPMLTRPDPYWASLVGGVKPCSADVELADGDELHLAGVDIRVMHTPGHSPGGVCFVTSEAVFCGDTLFAGSIGRTDLPGSDHDAMVSSLDRLVSELPDEMLVYPGHGPATTIGEEKTDNPFIEDLSGW